MLSVSAAAQYCKPPGGDCVDIIEKVTLSNLIYNGSKLKCQDSSSFAYWSQDTVYLRPGINYVLNVRSVSIQARITAWVDTNYNADFEQGEQINLIPYGGDYYSNNGVITLPAAMTEGVGRIRVMSHNQMSIVDPCVDGLYGNYNEVVDFPIKITNNPPNPYCTSSGNCGEAEIVNVTVPGENNHVINNTTAGCTGYSDFTSKVAELAVETPYQITSKFKGNRPLAGGYVFIDWNNNGTLDDAGEQFVGTYDQASVVTYAVTPPATATNGLKRMRVVGWMGVNTNSVTGPCEISPNEGDVEDYTILLNSPITPLPDCVSQTGISPADSATKVCTGTDSLKWVAAANADGYLVTLINHGNGNVILYKDTIRTTAVAVTGLLMPGTTYKWIAEAYNADGEAYACDTFYFFTAANADPVLGYLYGSSPFEVCTGDNFSIIPSITNGTPAFTPAWSGPDVAKLSATNVISPQVNTTTAGNFVFYFKLKDSNNCFDTLIARVNVSPSPAIPTIELSEDTICFGDSARIKFSGGNYSSYRWVQFSNGGGAVAPIELSHFDVLGFYSPVVDSVRMIAAIFTLGNCEKMSDTIVLTPRTAAKPIIDSTAFTFCDSLTLTVSNYASASWSTSQNGKSITITQTGDYTATSTVFGCPFTSDPFTATQLNKPAVPTITATSGIPACTGIAVHLASSETGNNSWSSGENTDEIDVSTDGSYTVTVTNGDGCTNTSAAFTVNFKSPPAQPVITLLNTTALCDGDSAQLKSDQPSGNSWSSGETSQTLTTFTPGTYTVTYANADGCSAISDPITIDFLPKPAKPAVTVAPAGPYCEGDMIYLLGELSDSYEWSTGENTQDITVLTTGSYVQTVISSNGCSNSSDTIDITVNPKPAKPVISSSGPLCTGRTTELVSSYSSGNFWSEGSVTDRITIMYSADYFVEYTDANGCRNTSDTLHFDIQPTPAKPVVQRGGDSLYTNDPGPNYQWYSATGPIPGATNANFHPATSGEYFVVVTNAEGCSSDSSVHYQFGFTGITGHSKDPGFSLSPNPNRNSFKVHLSKPVNGIWSIKDIQGRTVLQGIATRPDIQIEHNLPSGLYLFVLENGEQLRSEKFIVD